MDCPLPLPPTPHQETLVESTLLLLWIITRILEAFFSSLVELNLPCENPLQCHSLSTERRHHGSV